MISDSPTVLLELESKPETLTLVRGVLGGIAEPLAIDPELLDDLKTAVSEACNNVVVHAYDDDHGPMAVRLYVTAEGIEVVVRDRGSGIPHLLPSGDRAGGVGVHVIRALAERAEFAHPADGGTEVRMAFPRQRAGKALFELPEEAAPEEGWAELLSGDLVASLSPVTLLPGILGRLARAFAANARFSLDRFSDVYLVTDAIAAHAARAASGARIVFCLNATPRRLTIVVGPFRAGTGAQLFGTDTEAGESRSTLGLLTDELVIEPIRGAELLRIVIVDHRRESTD